MMTVVSLLVGVYIGGGLVCTICMDLGDKFFGDKLDTEDVSNKDLAIVTFLWPIFLGKIVKYSDQIVTEAKQELNDSSSKN